MSDDISTQEIEVGDRIRTFHVVDRRPEREPRPLFLVFHGSRQDGRAHRRFTGAALDALAEDEGAIVAYLDGFRGNWNDARAESAFPARREGVDDVGFARAVVDELVRTRGADPRRVVGIGYSNGGQMVMRLLHEAPDLLAAAIIVAATMPVPGSFRLPGPTPSARPVPVTLVHGTADPIAPYAGGRMNALARTLFRVDGTVLSAPETAAYFAERNGIRAAPAVTAATRVPRERRGVAIVRTRYRDGARPPVDLVTIDGGGHTVPGPHAGPRIVGRTARGVSIADLARDALAAIPAPR